MADWEERLSPLAREKLAKIGEPTPEEKERMKKSAQIKVFVSRIL